MEVAPIEHYKSVVPHLNLGNELPSCRISCVCAERGQLFGAGPNRTQLAGIEVAIEARSDCILATGEQINHACPCASSMVEMNSVGLAFQQ